MCVASLTTTSRGNAHPNVPTRGGVGTLLILLVAATVVLVSAVLSGAVGFGFALAATPILLLLFPPKQAIATVAVVGLIPLIYGVIVYRRGLSLNGLTFIFPTSLVGLLLGLPVLFLASPSWIRIIGGSASIAMAVTLQLKPGEPFPHERWGLATAGLLRGILQGTSGQGGPPVALVLTKQHWGPVHIWGTMTTYFLAISPIFLGSLIISGAIPKSTWPVSVALAVPVLLGSFVGNLLRVRVAPQLIRTVTLLVVAWSGIAGVIGGMTGLIHSA